MAEKLLVKNYNLWKEMMLFDVTTGDYDIVERNEMLGNRTLNGAYIEEDGWVTLFYKVQGRLFFVAKGQTYCLHDYDCEVKFERKGQNNEFLVEVAGKTRYTHLYRSYWYDPINMADITFNDDEEENQDFHLFVYNVMNDKAWQERIYS